MEWIVDLLRSHPELAIFLTLALGFWIGKIKVAGFGLGIVTSVLLVGVLVGQLDIPVTGPLKSVFFLLFLFAIGYKVGPQFFSGQSPVFRLALRTGRRRGAHPPRPGGGSLSGPPETPAGAVFIR